MSATKTMSLPELAMCHPVVSILYSRGDEPGAFDAVALQEFVDYELAHGSRNAIPYTQTDFYTDYINFSVVRFLGLNRKQYGTRHFRFNIRDILNRLARLAYLNVVRQTKITEAMVLKVLPQLDTSVPTDAKNTQENAEEIRDPDLEFRSFGMLEKEVGANKKVLYVFHELCVRDYLVALFLSNECHRKVSSGREGYHLVSSTMRESMRKLPDTGDIWRMAFGMMSDEAKTKEAQSHILKEVIEECKLINELNPFDITNLCVEAIYESQNAGELTALVDEFLLNQTIRYSSEYVPVSRLPYAVSALGYMVRASDSVYGVHMSQLGLNAKNIGMLADPVNDVSDNNLQVLNLSGNSLGPNGMKGLLRFLVKATLLTHLDLNACELGNVGLALMSEFFMCMPLRYLRLSENKIGDSGIRRMMRNLQYIPTLEWLDLSDNDITDLGAECLGKALVHLPNLRSLDLRRNKIGDSGVDSITENMAKLDQVTQLMLSENKIGEKGATKLSAHVWKTKSLRYVNLTLNNIPPEGIMGLRKAAKDHGDLRISVSNTTAGNDDLNTSVLSEGEFILSPQDDDQNQSPQHPSQNVTMVPSINLLEGRDSDFNRKRQLRRTWSGRSNFRRSWHGMTGSFRKAETHY